MTTLWTSAEIAAACHGSSPGSTPASWTASGISIDSRNINVGDLFIALQGPKFDGHAFVAGALASGAAGALVHCSADRIPTSLHHRLVVVKDTFIALNELARAARARTKARVVAITGSVGKTGTKDMLQVVLAPQGKAHATAGNLNNHWGVPLTLARLPRDARFAVVEIGMNHPGEIAPLAKLAAPHTAVVTTVAAVHLEFFDSVAGIAAEKASIAAGIEPNGCLILPADNSEIDTLQRIAAQAGVANVVTFGAAETADVRLVDFAVNAGGTQVVAEITGQRLRYDLGLSGRHAALNSLAVIAAARALGADLDSVTQALAHVTPTEGRGNRSVVPLAGGDITVIDESYNASPTSILALAETSALFPRRAASRLVLVLGDMLELGAEAPALHAGLAQRLVELKVDVVFTAGSLMEHLHTTLPRAMRGGHAEDSLALLPLVVQSIKAGDVIAVKGSHGSNMRPVVDGLTSLATAPRPARVANGH